MAEAISPDYGQQFLFPPALEDWVASNHPARFLREFVDELDLPSLGFAMPVVMEGRPPYAPSLLLKIWLYGYFQRIRSTRKLEAACKEQLPLLWLCGLLSPDHNSLWRFWRDNKKALRGVFRQTVRVAMETGAVGLALQALDGTKIEAAASSRSGWSKEYMEKVLAALDGALDNIELKVMEENTQTSSSPTVSLPAGMADRKALREQIQKGLAQLAADKRNHYHPVEPEARRMEVGNQNRFAYNAQAVVDTKEGIVVACQATRQETDGNQLVPLIEQAQDNLGSAAAGTDRLTVADTGYGSGTDLQSATQKGYSVLVPPLCGNSCKDHPYAAHRFIYDEQSKSVTCPLGQPLDHEGQTTKRGQIVQRYRCHCQDCPVRQQCTTDPQGRRIEIWPHRPVVQAMQERLKQPQMAARYAQRYVVERPFAQLKQHDGFRRWTVWGLAAVKAQWWMLCTTLNLRILYRRWRTKFDPANSAAATARVRQAKIKAPGEIDWLASKYSVLRIGKIILQKLIHLHQSLKLLPSGNLLREEPTRPMRF